MGKEITQEWTEPTPNALALGLRYVELDAICREGMEARKKTMGEMEAILSASQKQLLDTLRQATALFPVIMEARNANLVGREYSGRLPMNAAIPDQSFNYPLTWSIDLTTGYSGLPGCQTSPVYLVQFLTVPGQFSPLPPGSIPGGSLVWGPPRN